MKSEPQRLTKAAILRSLRSLGDPRALAGMARFGINVGKTYGISAPKLHALAREIRRDHALSQQLWASGIHEARILAALIGEPQKLTAGQMDRWCRDFDSWDVVDASSCYLFALHRHREVTEMNAVAKAQSEAYELVERYLHQVEENLPKKLRQDAWTQDEKFATVAAWIALRSG